MLVFRRSWLLLAVFQWMAMGSHHTLLCRDMLNHLLLTQAGRHQSGGQYKQYGCVNVCPGGRYSPSGAAKCSECPEGRYSLEESVRQSFRRHDQVH